MQSGESLPLWTVVAQNDAADSGNEIHDDTVARQYGFEGGLVPGITVYGYMTGPLVAAFGPEWLDRGGMEFRLRRPVYEGETVRVRAEVTRRDTARSEVEIVVRNAADEVCALGTGWMLADPPERGETLPPRRALPEERWPAERRSFEREPVLGSVESVWKEERISAYLEQMQDPNAVYRDGVAHPAWILRLANLVVDRSVAVNPWIHVSSSVQNLRRARAGEVVETRARVLDLFEKNGHEYVDLSIGMTARPVDAAPEDAVPILRGEHRAIYKPRRKGEPGAAR